jgi:hypothetical protein
MYLATPKEIAERLNKSAAGRGETMIYKKHIWGPRAYAAGTTEMIPDEWRFTKERIENIMESAEQ